LITETTLQHLDALPWSSRVTRPSNLFSHHSMNILTGQQAKKLNHWWGLFPISGRPILHLTKYILLENVWGSKRVFQQCSSGLFLFLYIKIIGPSNLVITWGCQLTSPFLVVDQKMKVFSARIWNKGMSWYICHGTSQPFLSLHLSLSLPSNGPNRRGWKVGARIHS
jgi:hypothetical protein